MDRVGPVAINTREDVRVEASVQEPNKDSGSHRTRGCRRARSLVRRVGELHRRTSRPHPSSAHYTPAVEGMLGHGRAVLLVHGEVSSAAIPHLEALLDSVIALGIPALTVDLSDTVGATSGALNAIRARKSQVELLEVVEGRWP